MTKTKLHAPCGRDYVSPQCDSILVRMEYNIMSPVGSTTIPDVVEEDLDWEV